MTDNHRCETVVDEDGTVLGHARVSPDLSEEGRRALVEVERDAADPEAAAERGRRQAEGIARIRERARRRRGDAG